MEATVVLEASQALANVYRFGVMGGLAAFLRGPILVGAMVRDLYGLIPPGGGTCGGFCPRNPLGLP